MQDENPANRKESENIKKNKKFSSLKDVVTFITKSNKEFRKHIKEKGGYIHLLWAIIAHFFLYLLLYNIAISFSSLQDFTNNNIFVLALFFLLKAIYRNIKSRIPSWITKLLSGEFFYDCDIKLLRSILLVLVAGNILVLALNSYIYNILKPNKNN